MEEQLKLYTHYVVRDDIMTEIETVDIQNGKPILYVGTTPTTPTDVMCIFGIYINGNIMDEEILFGSGYLDKECSMKKLKTFKKSFIFLR